MSSTDWHRFLGLDVHAQQGIKRKRAPFEEEADQARLERWSRIREMDATVQLQRMLGPTAQFRGIQEDAIHSIVAGESPVVAVMATGAGKSLLFMLPAWIEQGGTTVVVVPLVALREHMAVRCRQLGISCLQWDARHPPDAAAVVLVTPESAVGEAFTTFLNRLRAVRQLDRIVIDECHVVLNQRYTFRKQMQQLGKLVGAETQMILLTATLPPSKEEELFRRMHFDRDQVKLFRDTTSRTNIAYSVIHVAEEVMKNALDQLVVRTVQKKLRQYSTGRILVYANSKLKVKQLALQFDCGAYYADASGRESLLKDFIAGKQRLLVATSALGMGVDIPDIRCVLHIGWPLSILDYAQESGRAGRDGLPSEALVIAQQGRQWKADDQQTKAEQAYMRLFVAGKDCRRAILDRYLDSQVQERTGCEEGEEKCDLCRGIEDYDEEEVEEEEVEVDESCQVGDEPAVMKMQQPREDAGTCQEAHTYLFHQQIRQRQIPRQRWIHTRQHEFGEVEWLQQQLAWWTGRCGLCDGAGEDSSHDIRECCRPESEAVKEAIRYAEAEICYERYAGCWKCGVPQDLCKTWESDGRGRYQKSAENRCQYRGTLMGSVFGIATGYSHVTTAWMKRLAEHGIYHDLPHQSLVQYLGRKAIKEIVEWSNLVEEFCWLTRLLVEV